MKAKTFKLAFFNALNYTLRQNTTMKYDILILGGNYEKIK